MVQRAGQMKKHVSRLNVVEIKILRYLSGNTRKYKIANKDIRNI